MTAAPAATTAPATTAATLVRRKPPRRVRRRRMLNLVATHAVLIALAIAFLLPFIFIMFALSGWAGQLVDRLV